jgi:hypothetical protein
VSWIRLPTMLLGGIKERRLLITIRYVHDLGCGLHFLLLFLFIYFADNKKTSTARQRNNKPPYIVCVVLIGWCKYSTYCTVLISYITAYLKRFSPARNVLRAHKITKTQRPAKLALGKTNYFCEHEREGDRKACEEHNRCCWRYSSPVAGLQPACCLQVRRQVGEDRAAEQNAAAAAAAAKKRPPGGLPQASAAGGFYGKSSSVSRCCPSNEKYACVHACICTCIRMHMRVHTRTQVLPCACICMHMRTHTHEHVRTQAWVTHVHVQLRGPKGSRIGLHLFTN